MTIRELAWETFAVVVANIEATTDPIEQEQAVLDAFDAYSRCLSPEQKSVLTDLWIVARAGYAVVDWIPSHKVEQ